MRAASLQTLKLFIVFLLVSFPAMRAEAAPGDLDPTFGSSGKVISNFGYWNTARAVVIQPDGKAVIAGSASNTVVPNDNFLIARYNINGSLDASFGSFGRVYTDFSGGFDAAHALVLQPDGKIVAAGVSEISGGSNINFALARYNAAGSLDLTFGTGGKVITDFNGGNDAVRALVLQTDGKLVAAGYSYTGNGWNNTLVRYNSDGSLDSAFGNGGMIINSGFGANALVLQADGKIVAVGSASNSITGNDDFELARFNADGTPDTTFGTGGRVTTDFGFYENASEVVIQPDGKILAAGGAGDHDGQGYPFPVGQVLARLHPDGSLDKSFGSSGKIFTQTDTVPAGLALQADGKIITTGPYGIYGFMLFRYNSNGTPDTTFGTGGRVTTDFDDISSAEGVAIQPDGKIVAAGFAGQSIALARYRGGSAVPRRAKFDFDGDGRSDISVFRPSDRTWCLNRSTQGFAAAQFGLSTDKIVPADYDGDGRTDIAVFRDGAWFWLNSSDNQFNAIQFGLTNDNPQPADFSGDGRAELAVYRNGDWFTLNLSNNQFNSIRFGLSTDKPVAADFDGDGRADHAVYRDGSWYLLRSNQGFSAIQFGNSTDKPIQADYDGDGKTDLAVFRPAEGNWYIRSSTNGSLEIVNWGLASDALVPADYDGDGRADIAVFRNGIWFLRQSVDGFSAQQFGLAGDKPAAAAYLP